MMIMVMMARRNEILHQHKCSLAGCQLDVWVWSASLPSISLPFANSLSNLSLFFILSLKLSSIITYFVCVCVYVCLCLDSIIQYHHSNICTHLFITDSIWTNRVPNLHNHNHILIDHNRKFWFSSNNHFQKIRSSSS